MSVSEYNKVYRAVEKLLRDFLGVLHESRREHQGVDLNKLRFQCLSALSELGGGAAAMLMLAVGEELVVEMSAGDLPCAEEQVRFDLPAQERAGLAVSPEKLTACGGFRRLAREALKQENAFARALVSEGTLTGALVVLQPPGRTRGAEEDQALAMAASQADTLLQAAEVVAGHIDLAMLDDVTGLFNRRYLTRRLVAEVSRATRHGQRLSLLNIVIDDFKMFVECNGREITEKLIRELAELLKSRMGRPVTPFAFRVSDVAVRYRGGEFFVILPETPKRGARTKAERLRMFVSSQEYQGGRALPRGKVTLSIGVATYPEDAIDAVSLLKQADKALRRAIQKGRNQVEDA